MTRSCISRNSLIFFIWSSIVEQMESPSALCLYMCKRKKWIVCIRLRQYVHVAQSIYSAPAHWLLFAFIHFLCLFPPNVLRCCNEMVKHIECCDTKLVFLRSVQGVKQRENELAEKGRRMLRNNISGEIFTQQLCGTYMLMLSFSVCEAMTFTWRILLLK